MDVSSCACLAYLINLRICNRALEQPQPIAFAMELQLQLYLMQVVSDVALTLVEMESNRISRHVHEWRVGATMELLHHQTDTVFNYEMTQCLDRISSPPFHN